MAAEEPSNPIAPATAPSPAPVSVLPQYPELILAAIEALDSKKGANKSRISKQIEASYGNLPAAHKTLLSHHLNKMKASGQLVVIQNNYVKFDPSSPPRRGRGRPSKPKEPLPEGTVVSPARSRGRPRKDQNALGLVSSSRNVAPSISGRKRGRPRKSPGGGPTPQKSSGRGRGRPRKEKTVDGSTPAPVTGVKRGRGRPPSVKKAVSGKSESTGEKRGRGRPPKVKTGASVAPAAFSGEKRGRGRPRKVAKTVDWVAL